MKAPERTPINEDRGVSQTARSRSVGGLVDHQHRVRIAWMRDHIRSQIVAHRIRVPLSRIQQTLHPVGRVRGGWLRERRYWLRRTVQMGYTPDGQVPACCASTAWAAVVAVLDGAYAAATVGLLPIFGP